MLSSHDLWAQTGIPGHATSSTCIYADVNILKMKILPLKLGLNRSPSSDSILQ